MPQNGKKSKYQKSKLIVLLQVPQGTFIPVFVSIQAFSRDLMRFSCEVGGPQKVRKNEKTQGFLGKNRVIFTKNFQNFGNQHKSHKYTSGPKFG